ncbi:hypothetical protein TrST_g12124 [Triparma strigata]|uniref:Importin N-terminal domain-containing protein n=1 Tax=Triparma strigata TaxID=1606541 RepID=A0A9W7EBD9_9STRA|nr:hypothetical protein TrST_g12124 [Triparma strigata]
MASLTFDNLCQALSMSFSPDKTTRNSAEAALASIKGIPGACPLLLQVVSTKTIDPSMRTAASINFKNTVRSQWINKDNPALQVHEADKPTIKPMLVELIMVETQKNIRSVLAEALYHMSISEYPHSWPELLPSLLNNIRVGGSNGDATRVYGSLYALRKLCKRFEYKPTPEGRAPLVQIVKEGFPLLREMLGTLLHQDGEDVGMIVKQTIKVFWSCTQFNLNTLTFEDLRPWFNMLHSLMAKKLPAESMPQGDDEREKWVWWKVKKWTIQIMTRLYSRYGNPKATEAGLESFATQFSTTVAPTFLEAVCGTLALRSQNEFCSDRVMMLCLSFLDTAIEQKATYKLLKPHLDFLLYNVCYNVLKLKQSDIEAFENDPHEYIARQNDLMSEFVDPSMAAMQLIEDLMKYRTSTVAAPLVTFLVTILNNYTNAPPQTRDHLGFDAALHILGCLQAFLKKKKNNYVDSLPGLMIQHVLPCFNSSVGFIRRRACWMTTQFFNVQLDEASFRTLTEAVLQRLNDPSLAVQVEAGKAFRYILEVPGTENSLLPVLPKILNEYFRIMQEISNEYVVSALDVIVEKFGEHISPHAISLVENLSRSFLQYCDVDDDEEDMEAAVAATQCLECIATVLRVVQDNEALFATFEPMLCPIIVKIMDKEGELIDCLEHGIDLITFLTYFQTKFSPMLWDLFPHIFTAFHEFAFDYVGMMVTPIDNFITKDFEGFCNRKTPDNVPYIDLVYGMSKKVLEAGDMAEEAEIRKALHLFLSIFHIASQKPESKPFVDRYVHSTNDITIAKLQEEKDKDFATTRVQCYTVIGSLLFYNAELEMGELEQRGMVEPIMKKWIEDAAEIDKYGSKKATVLGWLALLSMGSERLERNGINPALVVRGVIELGQSLSEDYNDRLNNNFDDEEEDEGAMPPMPPDGFDDDEFEGATLDDAGDEDGDINIAGNADYQRVISGDPMMMMGGFGADDWGDDDDDDDFESPLDDVNEIVLIEDVLNRFAAAEPQKFEAIKSTLPAETLNQVAGLFAIAAEARTKATTSV